MKAALLFLLALIMTGVGAALDVPFIFGEGQGNVADYTTDQLEQASINSHDLAGVPQVSSPSDDEILDFQVTGGGDAPATSTEKRVGDLKAEFDARVEPDNSRVNDEAVVLALKYPGDLAIDQIASIYSYLKNGDGERKGWGYVRDPRGIDYLRYANASLKLGDRANCAGGGDCDDFAILMAALVESVGGTTRIILARNSSIGGHAYTEVYLGSLSEPNNQVKDIISWLQQKYGTDRIYTHIDTDTKDVWMNLDWGADEMGNAHPGGPFFLGDKHIVLCIRDTYTKTPLRLPEGYASRTLPHADKFGLIAVLGNHSSSSSNVVVDFSPDGHTLAEGCESGTVKLWDTASGNVIRFLEGHPDCVFSVIFSPDGRTLASGSRDNTVKIWDTASGNEIRSMWGHTNMVRSVAFSPDGRTLASGSNDETIKLWDTASGNEIRTLGHPGYSGVIFSVAFSPDGRTLACGSYDGTIRLWDTASGNEIRTIAGHSDSVWSVAFSPDGRTLASGSRDNTAKIWDTASGVLLRTLAGHSLWVEDVVFSPDGRTLASGSGDGTVKIWDTSSGNEISTLECHYDIVSSVAFSPHGRTLASGSYDGTIRLWQVV